MNHLQGISHLKNHYYVIRHGKSKANAQEIIVSNPAIGTKEYGLVEEGRQQVIDSVTKAKDQHILDKDTIVVSSDFTRTKETAEITKDILKTDEIILTPKLRERFFGNWDQKHNRHYQNVWVEDIKDPHHKDNDVESTEEVLDRTTSLIKELEEQFDEKKILLVSHGDALQILQTGFEKVDSSQHRELAHLNTAEIRELTLN